MLLFFIIFTRTRMIGNNFYIGKQSCLSGTHKPIKYQYNTKLFYFLIQIIGLSYFVRCQMRTQREKT